jgi:hypothetical protein
MELLTKMAIITFIGPSKEIDAEAARSIAVSAGEKVHIRVIPAEDSIIFYTEADAEKHLFPVSRVITTEAFRDRFTPAELLAIVASSDAQVKYALLKLSTKEQPLVDLDNAEVIATMDRLVTLSLVTAARKTAILS